MARTNCQNHLTHIGIVACITLLSSCGSGSATDTMSSGEPDIGQAMEPAIATPMQPVTTTAESPQTPTTFEPTAAPAPMPVDSSDSTPPPVPVESVPEPTPISPEPIPEPAPDESAIEPIAEIAVPVNVSCTASRDDIQSSTLSLINEARSVARSCGDTFFEAAGPVTWNNKLAAAAQVHSDDMALHNFFSHTGSDGSDISQRIDAQQYNWRTIGENIAAGQQTTESVIDAWLDSPGHCQNIMNAKFAEVGVTCVENNNSDYSQYWTNVFGTSFDR